MKTILSFSAKDVVRIFTFCCKNLHFITSLCGYEICILIKSNIFFNFAIAKFHCIHLRNWTFHESQNEVYHPTIHFIIPQTSYHNIIRNRLTTILVFVLYCLGCRGKGIPFILPTLYHFGHKIFHLYNPMAHPINHRIWDGWIVLSGIMTIAFSLYVYCFRTMCFTNLVFDIVSREYWAHKKE